jgi:hypothetical protein
MKKFLTFIFSILCAGLMAQTSVSGTQSGSWTLDNSPYEVTGDIVVPNGQTLTIEAGVEVNFQAYYKFSINGNLQASGSANAMIVFTTDNLQTAWHGLRFNASSSGSHLQFCKIEYGKTSGSSFPSMHGGAIMLNNSDVIIEDCIFENNEAIAEENGMGGAIYGLNTSSSTQILRCTFIANHAYGEGGAIKLTGDDGALIEDCIFKNNTVLYGGGGICLYGCHDTRINGSLFVGNATNYSNGGAAFVEAYCERIVFANCTFYDNHADGGDGGAMDIVFSDASLTNTIVYNNSGAYSDNIFLDFGYAEINYCNTPFPDGAEGSNNIEVNPQFVDAAGGDFHLEENSPCVDAGIAFLTITDAYGSSVTTVDLDEDEYIGVAPDMGCFEYDPNSAIAENIITNFHIFPNPAQETIYLDEGMIDKLYIRNLQGKTIVEYQNIMDYLDISELPQGVYILTITQKDKVRSAKLIKN